MLARSLPGSLIRIGGPRRALLAALGALAATLALGAFGPRLPGLWPLLDAAGILPAMGLVYAGGAAMLAWHLARLSVSPERPGLAAAAALPAALVPAAVLPGIGAGALFMPLLLSLFALRGDSRHRVVALLVQCGAAATLAGMAINQSGERFEPLFLIMIAVFSIVYRSPAAANDNPSMERTHGNSWLPPAPHYANPAGDSEPGSG